MYALCVEKMLQEGIDPRNGSELLEMAKVIKFDGEYTTRHAHETIQNQIHDSMLMMVISVLGHDSAV